MIGNVARIAARNPAAMKSVAANAYVGNVPDGIAKMTAANSPVYKAGNLTSVPAGIATHPPKELAQQKVQAEGMAKARAEEFRVNEVFRADQGVMPRFADNFESAAGKGFNYPFVAGIAASGLGYLTGGLEKVGKIDYIGVPFRWLGKATGGAESFLNVPVNYINNTSLNEAAGGFIQGVDNLTNKVTSNESITGVTASLASSAEKNIPSIQKNISKAWESVATPLTKGGDALEKPLSIFAKRTLKAIENKHTPNVKSAVTTVEESLAKHVGNLGSHPEAHAHIESLKTAMSDLSKHIDADGIPKAATVREGLNNVHTALSELKGLKNQSDAFEGSLKNVTNALGEKKTVEGFMNKVKNLFSSSPSAQIEKAATSFENYSLLSKPGDAIRASGEVIANAKLHTLATNTFFTAGMVAQAAHTTHDLHSQVKDLVQLSAALEGKKDVSAFHVFTSSDVPKPVKAARSQILRSFSPRLVTEAIAAVFNIGMMRNNMGMASMIGLMAPSMINGMIQPKNQLLPVLHQMNLMTKAGQPLGRDAYAGLLAAGSIEIANNGGESNLLTRSVAEAYAEIQMSPTDVLKEIENGKMNARATEIQNKLHANGHKPGEKTEEAITAHNAELAEKAKIYGADKVDKQTPITTVAEPNASAANQNHHAANVAELPVQTKSRQDTPTTNISHIEMAKPMIEPQLALG